ncbi:MAG: RNA-directed DNA polymerase [Alphaproteobacteria bacterium]|nr:RNA-directed DNA polymerase [Alphaproteobacteria bacterium]
MSSYNNNIRYVSNRHDLASRLLKYGLFPEHLPPCFNSENFGNVYYRKIDFENYISLLKNNSTLSLYFPLTRDKNEVRGLKIPNFLAYFDLVNCISFYWESDLYEYFKKNWEYMGTGEVNPNLVSMKKDGRLFDMSSYKYFEEDFDLDYKLFSKYKVKFDITKFYDSIYSHSISWAILGKSEAKKHRNNTELFNNKLENTIMNLDSRESYGIPIGPDTSYVIADILLSKIDSVLRDEFENYYRFIDDYVFYAKDDLEVEKFRNILRRELYKYKLSLNDFKFSVESIPNTFYENWIYDIKNFDLKDEETSIKLFIDLLHKHSVLNFGKVYKFGMKTLLNTVEDMDDQKYNFILKSLIQMIFKYPYLISLLDVFFEKFGVHDISMNLYIDKLIISSVEKQQIDVFVWCLYLSIKYDFWINSDNFYKNNKFKMKDCLSLLMIFYYFKSDNKSRDIDVLKKYYRSSIQNKNDDDVIEYMNFENSYWLLEYELFFNGIIGNPYKGVMGKEFKFMKDNNINFMKFIEVESIDDDIEEIPF